MTTTPCPGCAEGLPVRDGLHYDAIGATMPCDDIIPTRQPEQRIACWSNGVCKTCGAYTHSCKCAHPPIPDAFKKAFVMPCTAREKGEFFCEECPDISSCGQEGRCQLASAAVAPTGFIAIDDVVAEHEKDPMKKAALDTARIRLLRQLLEDARNALAERDKLLSEALYGWEQGLYEGKCQGARQRIAEIRSTLKESEEPKP